MEDHSCWYITSCPYDAIEIIYKENIMAKIAYENQPEDYYYGMS